MNINHLGPEVPKRPANRKPQDNGGDVLKDQDHPDYDEDVLVRADLEDSIVQEQNRQLAEHDGGRVGEFERFGQLHPGLKGGY